MLAGGPCCCTSIKKATLLGVKVQLEKENICRNISHLKIYIERLYITSFALFQVPDSLGLYRTDRPLLWLIVCGPLGLRSNAATGRGIEELGIWCGGQGTDRRDTWSIAPQQRECPACLLHISPLHQTDAAPPCVWHHLLVQGHLHGAYTRPTNGSDIGEVNATTLNELRGLYRSWTLPNPHNCILHPIICNWACMFCKPPPKPNAALVCGVSDIFLTS